MWFDPGVWSCCAPKGPWWTQRTSFRDFARHLGRSGFRPLLWFCNVLPLLGQTRSVFPPSLCCLDLTRYRSCHVVEFPSPPQKALVFVGPTLRFRLPNHRSHHRSAEAGIEPHGLGAAVFAHRPLGGAGAVVGPAAERGGRRGGVAVAWRWRGAGCAGSGDLGVKSGGMGWDTLPVHWRDEEQLGCLAAALLALQASYQRILCDV